MREDNGKLGKTYVYTYDNGGNILSKQTYALTAAGTTPENPTGTNTYSYGNTEWGDQLTAYKGTAITYDALGNPLSYYNGNSTYSFVWSGRQLRKVGVDGSAYIFKYNDEGIRTSKTVNGTTTTYYLSGSKIISEETGSGATIYLYDGAGRVIGMQPRGVTATESTCLTYWYEYNLQGDVVGIYSQAGEKLASYVYDAWGNATVTYHSYGASIPAVINNPFRYRGYYYDVDLGLYYLQSRYYDANTGRFISPDDVSYLGANGDLNSYNLYAYCSNNPVMYADPSGHSILALLGILALGAIAGGTWAGIKSYQEGNRGFELFADIVFGSAFGLATAGAAIMTVSVFFGAARGIHALIMGVEAIQMFGVGALAFDFTAFFVAPLYGIEMEGVELEMPAPNNSY